LRPHILRVTITAETSHPAPLNFTHHPYFNLDGKSDYQTHKLTIAANEFLPCDNNNLPTGNIADVANTEFDFRTPKKLRNIPPLDHTFCLTQNETLKFALRLAASNGLSIEVWTTQVGMHIYDGQYIQNNLPGLEGSQYGPRAGLAIEAQNWPDAPNHQHFPSAIYSPSKPYVQIIEYHINQSKT